MRTRSKLVLAGLGATLLMALAVGSASARNFSISNQSFRATFNNLEFVLEGLSTTTCHVTLEGSLHERTIPKTPGTLIGYITRVATGNCNPNQVTILTERLPWHVSYEGFSGRLPDITLILIRAESFFRVSNCLARGPVDARFSRDPRTGHIVLTSFAAQNVSITNFEFRCPFTTAVFQSNGNGSVFQLNSTTRVSLTLI